MAPNPLAKGELGIRRLQGRIDRRPAPWLGCGPPPADPPRDRRARDPAYRECDPRGERDVERRRTPPLLPLPGDRGEPALRDLLAAVHRDLDQPVSSAGLAKRRSSVAMQHRSCGRAAAVRSVGAASSHQPCAPRAPRSGSAIASWTNSMSRAEPDIGERRMRAVEHAQLGGLVTAHVGDQLCAAGLPSAAADRRSDPRSPIG